MTSEMFFTPRREDAKLGQVARDLRARKEGTPPRGVRRAMNAVTSGRLGDLQLRGRFAAEPVLAQLEHHVDPSACRPHSFRRVDVTRCILKAHIVCPEWRSLSPESEQNVSRAM